MTFIYFSGTTLNFEFCTMQLCIFKILELRYKYFLGNDTLYIYIYIYILFIHERQWHIHIAGLVYSCSTLFFLGNDERNFSRIPKIFQVKWPHARCYYSTTICIMGHKLLLYFRRPVNKSSEVWKKFLEDLLTSLLKYKRSLK